MLYLGIDQHRNQLTVDLGNEEGDLIEHRQVRTGWETLRKYFDELRRRSEAEGAMWPSWRCVGSTTIC